MYTVYLADDEQLIREGLAETIPWESLRMRLVGTAEDGRHALRGIREHKPDIVLTDIRMPYLDGLELIGKIREVHPLLPRGDHLRPRGVYIRAVGHPAWCFRLYPKTRRRYKPVPDAGEVDEGTG